jgi:hypothetical protein
LYVVVVVGGVWWRGCLLVVLGAAGAEFVCRLTGGDDAVVVWCGVVGGVGEGALFVWAGGVGVATIFPKVEVVVAVVGVYVVLCRPHTAHCVPMCAVPHIGQGEAVIVGACAALMPHTWEFGGTEASMEDGTSSSISSSGEKVLLF